MWHSLLFVEGIFLLCIVRNAASCTPGDSGICDEGEPPPGGGNPLEHTDDTGEGEKAQSNIAERRNEGSDNAVLFEGMDSNHDGVIDVNEFADFADFTTQFERLLNDLDEDGDGALNRDEFRGTPNVEFNW